MPGAVRQDKLDVVGMSGEAEGLKAEAEADAIAEVAGAALVEAEHVAAKLWQAADEPVAARPGRHACRHGQSSALSSRGEDVAQHTLGPGQVRRHIVPRHF